MQLTRMHQAELLEFAVQLQIPLLIHPHIVKFKDGSKGYAILTNIDPEESCEWIVSPKIKPYKPGQKLELFCSNYGSYPYLNYWEDVEVLENLNSVEISPEICAGILAAEKENLSSIDAFVDNVLGKIIPAKKVLAEKIDFNDKKTYGLQCAALNLLDGYIKSAEDADYLAQDDFSFLENKFKTEIAKAAGLLTGHEALRIPHYNLRAENSLRAGKKQAGAK